MMVLRNICMKYRNVTQNHELPQKHYVCSPVLCQEGLKIITRNNENQLVPYFSEKLVCALLTSHFSFVSLPNKW